MMHRHPSGQHAARSLPRLKPSARLIHGAFFMLAAVTVIAGLPVQSVHAAEQGGMTQKQYNIPAGALSPALSAFAGAAGVNLSSDPALTEGLQTVGLSGSHDIANGFRILLTGTGLEAVERGRGIFILRKLVDNATTDGTAAVLPSVNVAAVRSDTSEGTKSYAAYSTTIGKTSQSLREIPQSVSVITRQKMDDQNATVLEDVMRYAPGVSAYGNHNGASSFYARGYTLEMQYDGIPGSSSVSGTQFDMSMYDRVEVLRGPNGLLQGSGNPSGTINLARKRARNDFALTGSVSAGSWNNHRAEVDVTGAMNEAGTVRGRAVVVTQDREYFYDRADQNKQFGYGILEFDLGPRTTLGLSAAVQRMEGVPFSGLPGYADGRFLGLPRSTNLDAPWSAYKRETSEVVADLTHMLDDNWTLKASLRYRTDEGTFQQGNPRGAVTVAGLASFTQSRSHDENDSFGADINLSGKFDAFGRKHDLLVGYNVDQIEARNGFASRPIFTSMDFYNPGYDESLLPQITSVTGNKTKQSGLYGMVRLKVTDPLTLILGGRFTDYSNKTRTWSPAATDWQQGAKADQEFTPYAGLVFDLNQQVSLYASYADIFIPQTTRDYFGQVLDPRVGWQFETGIKGEFFDGRLNASLAAFRVRDTNRPVDDPNPAHDNCGTTGVSQCQIAGGLMQTQGWEAEISGSPVRGLEVGAGYTRAYIEYLRDNNVANIGILQPPRTYLPRHVFKLWSNYQFDDQIWDGALQGWSIGGGLFAQSETFGGSGASRMRQGGLTVASLQAGYRINKNLHLSLTINNLFDKVYYHQINDVRSYNNYGEPRNFMLTLRGTY